MKVQLIVVRGKPEGKIIPLTGPKFKIGRGETCHLRPVNEQVSREHAEFEIIADKVMVRDLGSRNGTLVNGKAITQVHHLKDRDLVQVGPLTFAVSIQDAASGAIESKPAAPARAAAEMAAPAKPRTASPDDLSNDDIDSWLLGDGSGQAGDQPTTIYGGDTKTIAAFKDKDAPATPPANRPPSAVDDSEYERQDEDDEEEEDEDEELENEDEASLGDEEEEDEDEEEEDEDEDEEAAPEDEFIDESNPFYAAKKAQKDKDKPAAGGSTGVANNQTFKDSSDAANDILKKLMERRKASRS